jgi:acetyl esterase/lipase
MNLRRVLRIFLLCVLVLVASAFLLVGGVWWYFHPPFQHLPGGIYAQRKGHDLQFEVWRPPHPNGLGVLVLVSGKWKSGGPGLKPFIIAPLLRRGYTVFSVGHGSQPEFTVMEIVEDVQRAVRCIRRRAREFGVDPGRLGVTGGSSGGHLCLMLATRGGPGQPGAADPVDRESSAVQAVACYYPPTDLLNLGTSTENPGNGGPPKSFVKAFGPNSTNLAIWRIIGRDMSPIYHVTSNLPPVLIVHGGADTLVPLDQSERFLQKARAAGVTVKLVVRPGKQHGWPTMLWDERLFADWFDQYLRGPRTEPRP